MAYTSPIAGAIGLFRKDKLKKLWLNDELEKLAGKTVGKIDQYGAEDDKSLADYQQRLNDATGQINQLTGEDIGTLTGEIGKMKSYDPSGEYQGLGKFLTGLVGSFAPQLAGIGKGAVSLANAGLYGGKGGGAYGDNILLNNISRNLAPVFSQALSQINPAFNLVSNMRGTNLQKLLGTIGERASMPLRAANLATLPIQLRNAILSGQIRNQGDLANAMRQNLLGTQMDTNFAGKLSDYGNSVFNTAVDLGKTAASIYAGGGLGGLGGMIGGGGGAASSPKLPDTGFNTGNYMSQFEGTGGVGGGLSAPNFGPPPQWNRAWSYPQGFEGSTPPPNIWNNPNAVLGQFGYG